LKATTQCIKTVIFNTGCGTLKITNAVQLVVFKCITVLLFAHDAKQCSLLFFEISL